MKARLIRSSLMRHALEWVSENRPLFFWWHEVNALGEERIIMSDHNSFRKMSFCELIISLNSARFTEIEEIYKIWFGMYVLLYKIRDLASAVNVYSVVASRAIVIPKNIAGYLSILEESTENRLTSEIAELFDSAEMRGNKNCSIKRLKKSCEENEVFFPDGETDLLVKQMNDLISEYECSPIPRARNKQLSHHDFEQMFGNEAIEVSIPSLLEITEKLTGIITEIGKRLFPEGEPVFASIKDPSESYLNAIIAISKCKDS